MATLDDILGQGNGSGAASPAKGSQQRAEQNSGANAPEPQSVSQPQLQQAPEQVCTATAAYLTFRNSEGRNGQCCSTADCEAGIGSGRHGE